MKLNRLTATIMVIAALIIGAGGMYFAKGTVFEGASPNDSQTEQEQSEADSGQNDAQFEEVRKAYETISGNYFKDVDKKKLLDGAVQGMVKTLDDPFSSYMDAKTAKQFSESLSSSFEGIGAEVSMVNGKVTIISPIKDSPAEKAGVQPNDQIISIDGKKIEGLNLNEAVLKIRGKKGSTVTLGINRQGSPDLLKVKVKRDKIPLETVDSSSIKQDGHTMGLIAINSFSEGTAEEFGEALKKLEGKGMDGLVIDLRGNPGGYLGSVLNIGNMIIPNNKPIVQVAEQNGNTEKTFSKLKTPKDYPIVGLIDDGSASAAEILSADLHEGGGYPLVGTKSFGKGTVQTEFNIGQGKMKLTVSKWLTPDGNWIHKKGIKPTVKAKQPDYFHSRQITVKKGETLKYDGNGDRIKNAQQMLQGLGFETGREDGYFGEQTKTAVKAFQRTSDLSVTGKIDTKTASALDSQVIKKVNDKDNDLQLNTALGVLEKDL